MSERRVLVTGATGLVGRYFCARAATQGWQVRRCLRTPDAGGGPDVVTGDLRDFPAWQQALAGIDVVVHLAARVHQMNEQDVDVEQAYRSMNVDVTRRLVEAAIAAGVRRFVMVSTIKVHGEQSVGKPFVETDAPAPADWYARSKLEAEELLRDQAQAAGMEWVVVRPPLVFGPGVRGNFARLIRAVYKHLPLPVGCVRSLRSYVNVWNLADLLERCCWHDGAANEVFLAADCTLSTPDLVRQIGMRMGRNPWLLSVPMGLLRLVGRVLPVGPAIDRLTAALEVDASKARQKLGWEAVIGFDEALRMTVAGPVLDGKALQEDTA